MRPTNQTAPRMDSARRLALALPVAMSRSDDPVSSNSVLSDVLHRHHLPPGDVPRLSTSAQGDAPPHARSGLSRSAPKRLPETIRRLSRRATATSRSQPAPPAPHRCDRPCRVEPRHCDMPSPPPSSRAPATSQCDPCPHGLRRLPLPGPHPTDSTRGDGPSQHRTRRLPATTHGDPSRYWATTQATFTAPRCDEPCRSVPCPGDHPINGLPTRHTSSYRDPLCPERQAKPRQPAAWLRTRSAQDKPVRRAKPAQLAPSRPVPERLPEPGRPVPLRQAVSYSSRSVPERQTGPAFLDPGRLAKSSSAPRDIPLPAAPARCDVPTNSFSDPGDFPARSRATCQSRARFRPTRGDMPTQRTAIRPRTPRRVEPAAKRSRPVRQTVACLTSSCLSAGPPTMIGGPAPLP